MSQLWVQILTPILTAVASVVVGWVVLRIKKLGIDVTKKIQDKVHEFVSPAAEKAIGVVGQIFVDDLKKTGAWKVTRDENIAKAKALALEHIKAFLPKSVICTIVKLWGKENVDTFLASTIEYALKQKPNNADKV